MERVTVFCGSHFGGEGEYKEATIKIAEEMIKRKIGLVYGGANAGLMGVVADTILASGGEVLGVIPEFMADKEIAHEGLTKLFLVKSMHERKAKMNDLSDAFIALPGGFGTMDELFEILTWAQLGLHHKPIGLLNVNGFYDSLVQFISVMFEKGFVKKENRDLLIISSSIEELFEKMQNYEDFGTKK
jgi:uncharacterized protein (TIGR00730 family)